MDARIHPAVMVGKALMVRPPQRWQQRQFDGDSWWFGFASGVVAAAVAVLALSSLGWI
jgi:hypothetical protein